MDSLSALEFQREISIELKIDSNCEDKNVQSVAHLRLVLFSVIHNLVRFY